MKKIYLSGKNGDGKYALVDDMQFVSLSKHQWFLQGGYACRKSSSKLGKRYVIWMHRQIMQTPKGKITDHVNRDRLDNRIVNLRVCDFFQNTGNRKISIINTSGYRGVYWHKGNNKWHAQIKINGKTIHMGFYNKAIQAAKIYNKAAIKYFGEFANLNII